MCQLDGSDAVPPRGEDEKSAANLYAVTSRRLSHGSRETLPGIRCTMACPFSISTDYAAM